MKSCVYGGSAWLPALIGVVWLMFAAPPVFAFFIAVSLGLSLLVVVFFIIPAFIDIQRSKDEMHRSVAQARRNLGLPPHPRTPKRFH